MRSTTGARTGAPTSARGYLKEPFVLDEDGCVAVPQQARPRHRAGRRRDARDHGPPVERAARGSRRPALELRPEWRATRAGT